MKNKISMGIILLLLINIVMTGFLISKLVVGDKLIEKVNKFVDGGSKYMSEEISEVKGSETPQILPDVNSQTERAKTIRVEIWVDEENNIHRTGVSNDVDSLHWVIICNGEQVLSRNALNETVYQYYRNYPGIYTVYVESFIDGSYRVVSNVVSYSIK